MPLSIGLEHVQDCEAQTGLACHNIICLGHLCYDAAYEQGYSIPGFPVSRLDIDLTFNVTQSQDAGTAGQAVLCQQLSL